MSETEEKPEPSDIEVLCGIRDICRESPDGLTAWRTYRIRFGENRIQGRTAGDREQAFMGMYQAYTRYPAQFTMDLRIARVRAFMKQLAEAFLSTDVPEDQVEAWFEYLEAAKHGPQGVIKALNRLGEVALAKAAPLLPEAHKLWPSIKDQYLDGVIAEDRDDG